MNGTVFLENMITHGQECVFRLCEGRDIQAVPVAQDDDSIVVRRTSGETALIYKKAISVITPIAKDKPGG